MIRRIQIKDYKSLKNVEMELQPLTVIMGPNAAGKSNLFDALRLSTGTVRATEKNETKLKKSPNKQITPVLWFAQCRTRISNAGTCSTKRAFVKL